MFGGMDSKPLSEKCLAHLEFLTKAREEGGCVPKEEARAIVACRAKEMRQAEGTEFGDSMKKAWAEVKELQYCEV